jgi:hypothetical protein
MTELEDRLPASAGRCCSEGMLCFLAVSMYAVQLLFGAEVGGSPGVALLLGEFGVDAGMRWRIFHNRETLNWSNQNQRVTNPIR